MQYLKPKPKRVSGFSYKPNALIRNVGPQPLEKVYIFNYYLFGTLPKAATFLFN